MKRLRGDAAEWTREDQMALAFIWIVIGNHGFPCDPYEMTYGWLATCEDSDRSDADLMLGLERQKLGLPGRLPHVCYAPDAMREMYRDWDWEA